MSAQPNQSIQGEVSLVTPEDFPRVVDVWEASVRATHLFLTESDIQLFKPLVHDALPQMDVLAGMRDRTGAVIGFVGVAADKIEMLFIHPQYRGTGTGRRLVEYAIHSCGATQVDVNEQNEQATGFYQHMGFVIVGRSPMDSLGQPFPLLHMRLAWLQPS